MEPADTAAPRPAGLARWAPLALIVAGLATFFALGWHKYLSFEQLKAQREALTAFVGAQPLLAALAFAGVYALCTVLMIPGSWLTISGGFLFGLVRGTGLSVVAATVGASLLFLIARTTLGETLRRRVGPFLTRLEAGFSKNPFSYMLTLRFLPVVPFAVANIAPALLGARLRDFVTTTALGIVPGTLAYAWIGSGLGAAFDSGQEPDLAAFGRELLPAFLALAAVSIAPAVIQRLRARKSP